MKYIYTKTILKKYVPFNIVIEKNRQQNHKYVISRSHKVPIKVAKALDNKHDRKKSQIYIYY